MTYFGKIYRRGGGGGAKLIIGVCPIYMSRRVVHKINYRSMSNIYESEGCPQNY